MTLNSRTVGSGHHDTNPTVSIGSASMVASACAQARR